MLSPQTDGPGLRLGLDDYSEDFGRPAHFGERLPQLSYTRW
ncbi:hypothetical protein ABT025_05440 [Streptomyces sp. NPDC002809]